MVYIKLFLLRLISLLLILFIILIILWPATLLGAKDKYFFHEVPFKILVIPPYIKRLLDSLVNNLIVRLTRLLVIYN